jgi:hypothetical protein
MGEMNCRDWAEEIVELARSGAGPGEELRWHLQRCPDCHAHWTAEVNLNLYLDAARKTVLQPRVTAGRKAELMARFAAMPRGPRVFWHAGWSLAAAAMLVMAIAAGAMLRLATVQTGNPVQAQSVDPAGMGVTGAGGDFVTVPYAPPLATGETVRVEVAELAPGQLAGMGLELYLADTDGTIPVELALGEDGFPRAVRVLETSQY